ncbi:MAG: NFACT family protein [Candidatus Bipolaricaulota bacterium]|nr:NFACT family protein [Candidatus Bipolaricaulota bacterium]
MDGLSIAASVHEIAGSIIGGSVRAIYEPAAGVFTWRLFAGREVGLLVSPARARFHLTSLELRNPERPSPFVMLLRRFLRGGRISRVEQRGWDRVVRIEVESGCSTGAKRFFLVAELIGQHGNLLLLQDGKVIASLRPSARSTPGARYRPLSSQGKIAPERLDAAALRPLWDESGPQPGDEAMEKGLVNLVDGVGRATARAILARARADPIGALEERLRRALSFVLARVNDPEPEYCRREGFASFFPLLPPGERMGDFHAALDLDYRERQDSSGASQELARLRRGLTRAVNRHRRAIDRLQVGLKQANEEERLRQHADTIMANLSGLQGKMSEAELRDPYRGKQVRIELDPRLSPVENAQTMYERAKRLRRGRAKIKERLRRFTTQLSLLERELAKVKSGKRPSSIAVSPIPSSTGARQRTSKSRPKVYMIEDYQVQVGKNAAQNDVLLRQARPDDLWLHARGIPGAHVIIRRHGREEIPDWVLTQAAGLAAAHSTARGEGKVEVSYTPVKYVHRPKGTPAGFVILKQEATLMVN